jgi:hypothetical protein
MPTGDHLGTPLTVCGRPLNSRQLPRSTGPARVRAADEPKGLSTAGGAAATSTRASQPDSRHDRRSTSICSVTHRASAQAWSSPATAVAAAASAARSAALSARCLVTTAEANNSSPLSTAAAAPMPPTVHMVAEPRSLDRSSQFANGERSSGTHRANGNLRAPATRVERRPLSHPTRGHRTPTRDSRRPSNTRRTTERHRMIHSTRINKACTSLPNVGCRVGTSRRRVTANERPTVGTVHRHCPSALPTGSVQRHCRPALSSGRHQPSGSRTAKASACMCKPGSMPPTGVAWTPT